MTDILIQSNVKTLSGMILFWMQRQQPQDDRKFVIVGADQIISPKIAIIWAHTEGKNMLYAIAVYIRTDTLATLAL